MDIDTAELDGGCVYTFELGKSCACIFSEWGDVRDDIKSMLKLLQASVC